MSILKSRKFWASVVAILLLVVKEVAPNLQIDEATVNGLVATIVAYILGTALEDGLSKRAQ